MVWYDPEGSEIGRVYVDRAGPDLEYYSRRTRKQWEALVAAVKPVTRRFKPCRGYYWRGPLPESVLWPRGVGEIEGVFFQLSTAFRCAMIDYHLRISRLAMLVNY